MDDCAETVETMLQWLSESPTARNIDAAFNTLGEDLLAERPLLHYLRYNVQLDCTWLRENLDQTMTEKRVRKLRKMDRPKNMQVLAELGEEAAKRQVDDSHFPPIFDLG